MISTNTSYFFLSLLTSLILTPTHLHIDTKYYIKGYLSHKNHFWFTKTNLFQKFFLHTVDQASDQSQTFGIKHFGYQYSYQYWQYFHCYIIQYKIFIILVKCIRKSSSDTFASIGSAVHFLSSIKYFLGHQVLVSVLNISFKISTKGQSCV